MDPVTFTAAAAHNGARIAEVCRGALSTPVPFVAGWTLRELMAHQGGVFAFAAANARAGSTEPISAGTAGEAPDGDAIGPWFEETRQSMVAALTETDTDAVAWTFAGVKTVGFWQRRMAAETLVHRLDAELATDQRSPVDPALATDAVQEYLDVGLRFSSSRPDRVYPEESLHLHRRDGEGEWMLQRSESGGVAITHEHGKGDAAVRGTAEELLLWVWGRPADVEVFGDAGVATAWQQLAP